jgi:hypothetical protein
MRPPAKGSASFSLTAVLLDIVPSGNLVRFLATIRVGKVSSQPRRSLLWRRETTTTCSLQILVNGTILYDERLFTTDINKYVISNSFEAAEYPEFQVIQECGSEPIDLTFAGPAIENSESNTQGKNPFWVY